MRSWYAETKYFTASGQADFTQDRPDHKAHEPVDAGPRHAADDVDKIEEPVSRLERKLT